MRVPIVVGVACLFALFFLSQSYRARLPLDPRSDQRVTVTVEQGMSARDVGRELEDKGVIRSARAFARLASQSGAASSIKAGSYVFTPSQTPADILDQLVGGRRGEVIVTVPEGFTVKDIDALLASKGLTETGSVLACAQTCDFSSFAFLPPAASHASRGGVVEGYLFPDTYFVDPSGFSPESFLKRQLTTFQKRVVDVHERDIASSGRTLDDIVIMASLIEEETRAPDERPMVSGILWKRFDIGMGLQVDATVRYILDKPTASITQQDLQTDSPYNTRKYRGLPPGPIANPGLLSIEAALRPKQSPYLYYLHGRDGVIRYAETNEEHNRNRARYL